MSYLYLIVGLVVVQRLAELAVSTRNTKRLLKSGGQEIGRRHYPLFVMLHAAWLIALLVFVDPQQPLNFTWLTLFVMLQFGRIWVVLTLGMYWTTRIITVPGTPVISTGPYRYCRHPNYLIVAGEIAVLPLVFGAWELAIVFSVLNGALLLHRIKVEDGALESRRERAPEG